MATLKPSDFTSLKASQLSSNGAEFFPIFRKGENYTLTLSELKKYIGTGSSGGGGSVDLTSVDSNIIPDSNNQHVLGYTEYAWKSLYLGDSINFTGDKGTISGAVNIDGSLKINNLDVAMKSEVQAVSNQLGNYLKNSSVKVSNVYTSYPDIVTAIPERYYAVHKDAAGNLMVQVPWEKGASGDFLTKSQADSYYLPLKTIDSVVTYGSSNLITSGAVENRVRTLEEEISTRGYLTSSLADSTYLKKNSDIELGTHIIKGNGGYDVLNSVGEWVIVGNGTSAAGKPTYIDGNEIYLRYGTAHTTGVKINSNGNVDIYGSIGNDGSIFCKYGVFSYTSGDGLYMTDYNINAHNKGTYTRQLLKFDPSSGKVNLVNGFETNVTSYIGSSSNEDYKALVFRRSGNGFRLNATSDYGYLVYGPLNSNKDEVVAKAVIRFNDTKLEYSPNDTNYHDILTSNSLKIGEYAFQDRTENRLSSTTNLDNVSYGVWGTLDNTTYTNAPTQNFGLIVSRLNQGYKGQFLLPYYYGDIYYRAQGYEAGAIKWGSWRKLAFIDDIPSVTGFLKEGFSINNAAITTLTASTIKYTGGTSSAYWELNNQGGGAGNRPAFTKNLQIKDGSTYYENVHSGNISSYAITQHQDISGKADKSGYTANNLIGADANGNIHSTSYQTAKLSYINTLTSNAQDQINALSSRINVLSAGGIVNGLYSFNKSLTDAEIGMAREIAELANAPSGDQTIVFNYRQGYFQLANRISTSSTFNVYKKWSGSDKYNKYTTNSDGSVTASSREDTLFYSTSGGIQRVIINSTGSGYELKTIIRANDVPASFVNAYSKDESNNKFLTQQWADSSYLSKTDAIHFGSTATFKNANALFWMDSSGSGAHSAMSVNASNQLCIGYGTSQASMLTFIDGYELYLRYGTAHTTGVKINSNGVVDVYSSLRVGNTSLGNGTSSIHIYRNSYNVPYIRFSAKNSQGVDFTCGEIGVNNATGMPMYWNTVNNSTAWKSFITEDNISNYLTDYTKNVAFESFVLSAITTDNYSSYALPLSGGNITGAINTSSNISFSNTTGYHINYPGAKWSVSATGAATFLSVSQTSDATKKNILGNTELTLSQIANAPAVDFTWKDSGEKSVGTIAQYWKSVLPEVVSGDEGRLGMNYATLGVVASIVIARSVETNAQRIASLEMEIESLQKELASLNKSA